MKDIVMLLIIISIYFSYVCLNPDLYNHPDNYLLANPMVTPAHIIPE